MGVLHQAQIQKIETFGSDYLVLTVKRPPDFEYSAGQYTNFHLQDSDGIFLRSYSIASSPGLKDVLQFCVQISTKDKRGVECIKRLSLGDSLQLSPAQGNFKIIDRNKPILFIAGGSGISPIRSLLNDLLLIKQNSLQLTLIYGCRDAQAIPFYDEFLDQFQKFAHHFRLILTADQGDAPHVSHGTVIDVLRRQPELFSSLHHYYYCGPPSMMEAMHKILAEAKIEESQIFFESYSSSKPKTSI